MKILFLDQYSDLGGAQHTLLDTAEALREQGWQARALVPGSGPLIDRLESLAVPCHDIPCGPYRSGKKSALDAFRFALDLRGQIRTINEIVAQYSPHVIYVNGPRLVTAAALAKRGDAQVIFHAHSHVHGIAARLLCKSIRRANATVVACSQSVLNPLRRCTVPQRVHVIPNGVRDAGFRERSFGGRANWQIGIIGRILPDKGQLEFAAAAGILSRDFPDARFVVCGDALFGASAAYSKTVRLQARNLPLTFLPWQPDIGSVLAGLDLLIVPSKREGMSRVIVEAFSAGVPVIAFPAGGIPEVIVDDETGFLTQEFSVDALTSRIREVLQSPEIAQRIASNARQAWARLYTISRYQERIIRVLEQCLPNSRLVSSSAWASPAERGTEMPPLRTLPPPQPTPADNQSAPAFHPR